MHASLLGKPHVLRLLGARDCGLVLALFLFFLGLHDVFIFN